MGQTVQTSYKNRTPQLVELLTGSVFRGFASFPYDDPKWWEMYHENQNCHRKIIGTGKNLQTFIHEGLLLCYGGQVHGGPSGQIIGLG